MKIELYTDRQRQHRWRLRARNGRVIANCGEGYRRRIDCLRVAQALFPKAALQERG